MSASQAHNESAPAGQHAHGAHGESHDDHGIKRYVIIWLVLLGMTWLTWFTGRMDLGAMNIVVAMIIASTKATLVVLFFMHLWDEGSVNRLVFAIAILFVAVLILGTFGDLMFRLPVTLPPGGTGSTLPL